MPKAAVLFERNTPLEVVELDIDAPASTEIVVAIAASGICHSDLSVQHGVMTVPLPLVLGHEGAGIVTHIGDDVTDVAVGDHVVLSWVASCGRCYWCERGEVYLCGAAQAAADAGTQLDGTRRLRRGDTEIGQMSSLGTFAEQVVVPAKAAIPIRADVPLEIAALIGCGVLTGLGAATRSVTIDPGDTVVVFGCGGVGLNAIQGARLQGAGEVVAVDLSPAKLDLATTLGATRTVDAGEVDALTVVRELTDGRGADIAFEVSGNEDVIRQAIRSTRRGGHAVLVGIPGPDARVETKAMNLIYGARSIHGCWYGSCDPRIDVPRIIDLHDEGLLELRSLISREISIDEVNEGLDDLATGVATRSVIRF